MPAPDRTPPPAPGTPYPPGTPYQPGTPYPPQGPREVTDAERAAARRWVRIFGLVLLVSMGLGVLPLPWPMPVVSSLGCLAALVVGIIALVKVRAARLRGPLTVILLVGIVLAGLMGMTAVSQVVLWEEYAAYEQCQREALTEQAKAGCRADLEQGLQDWVERTEQSLLPAGG